MTETPFPTDAPSTPTDDPATPTPAGTGTVATGTAEDGPGFGVLAALVALLATAALGARRP